MRFHFMRYFVNSIIFRVSYNRLLYCVFIEVDFEKKKMLEIFIFLQKEVNLERETQHAVITHVNTSNGIKILTFLEKVGDDVILVQCPFNWRWLIPWTKYVSEPCRWFCFRGNTRIKVWYQESFTHAGWTLVWNSVEQDGSDTLCSAFFLLVSKISRVKKVLYICLRPQLSNWGKKKPNWKKKEKLKKR